MKNARSWRCLFTLLAVIAVSTAHADGTAVPNTMVGHWEGNTKVIVEWCDQTHLPVTLDISPDGKITGVIGDARLTNAQLKEKSNWLGQKKSKGTTHIITGKLEGHVVAAEEIRRDKVFIHIGMENDSLVGSLASSGSKTGGKEDFPNKAN